MESCGLICHQNSTRVYGKLTCANLTVATVGVGVLLTADGSALDWKGRTSSPI